MIFTQFEIGQPIRSWLLGYNLNVCSVSAVTWSNSIKFERKRTIRGRGYCDVNVEFGRRLLWPEVDFFYNSAASVDRNCFNILATSDNLRTLSYSSFNQFFRPVFRDPPPINKLILRRKGIDTQNLGDIDPSSALLAFLDFRYCTVSKPSLQMPLGSKIETKFRTFNRFCKN